MALPNVMRFPWLGMKVQRDILLCEGRLNMHLLSHSVWYLLILCGTTEEWSSSPPRVRKILNLRVFEDESGKHWSKSVMDKQYEVLCVSQFTLQCILKGNKPDYHMAMPTEQAESFYNNFLEQLRKAYKPELIKGKDRRLVRSLMWPVDTCCVCSLLIVAFFILWFSVAGRMLWYFQ